MNTEIETKSAVRMYFVCMHVIAGAVIEGYLTNQPDDRKLQCGDCYWGIPTDDPPHDFDAPRFFSEEGTLFSESEAVDRGWIPKSRAMQYLLYATNDGTGGMAVDSRSKKLARILDRSGLNEIGQHFLYHLFKRGDSSSGWVRRMVLTEGEEATADLLTDRMFKDDPTVIATIERELHEDPIVHATLEKFAKQDAEQRAKDKKEARLFLIEAAKDKHPDDPDPFLLLVQIQEFWKAAFDNGWKRTDVIAFLKADFNVDSPKELRQSQFIRVMDTLTKPRSAVAS